MLLGFALTQHCNLRCPHCIRDDVTTVRSLEADFVLSVTDQARELFGETATSFTGGEPLLHPEFEKLLTGLHERGVAYRFVSNGWHLKRVMPLLDRYRPMSVRLSLSGADEPVHDEERGRGSFRRVLLSVALLTSRAIPTWLAIVIDQRTRHQIREVADLAEALGVTGLQYILPQPVPASAARGTDLPPDDWWNVVAEVKHLASDASRKTFLEMAYGHPMGEQETACDTFSGKRVYVDAFGRLSLCCQLSDYGNNEADVIANLHKTSLRDAWPLYLERLNQLQTGMMKVRETDDPVAPFPCLRCARSCGKLSFIDQIAGNPFARAGGRALPVFAAAI